MLFYVHKFLRHAEWFNAWGKKHNSKKNLHKFKCSNIPYLLWDATS